MCGCKVKDYKHAPPYSKNQIVYQLIDTCTTIERGVAMRSLLKPKKLWSGIIGSALLCFSTHMQVLTAATPLEINGQLKVIGKNLCNKFGNPVQLRGMSTHGLQWYGWGLCLNEQSLNTLAYSWGADILRISLYVQEDGYETNPAKFTAMVDTLIEQVTKRGMYALVDWHQLDPGDPNYNLAKAKTFFTAIATKHKNKNNIIYDICNEPNGCTWAKIKAYADSIIPLIRDIDSDAPIAIGTHGWSSFGISDDKSVSDIINNQVNFSNVMYTFHFYAASHGNEYYNELKKGADTLPLFITEFGTQEYTGDGPNNFTMSQKYLDLLAAKKIGWTCWNYSDDFRSGAVWKEGACPNGPWEDVMLKPAGVWIKDKIQNPPDQFFTSQNHVRKVPTPDSYKLVSKNNSKEYVIKIPRSADQEKLTLIIYNFSGKTVYKSQISPQEKEVVWRGVDKSGKPVPSGTYLFRVMKKKTTALFKVQKVQ
jgi:aryl-phospho-beta-D-glucosidase BglC (GH1 family)